MIKQGIGKRGAEYDNSGSSSLSSRSLKERLSFLFVSLLSQVISFWLTCILAVVISWGISFGTYSSLWNKTDHSWLRVEEGGRDQGVRCENGEGEQPTVGDRQVCLSHLWTPLSASSIFKLHLSIFNYKVTKATYSLWFDQLYSQPSQSYISFLTLTLLKTIL